MDSDALRAADRTLALAWAVLGRNGGFPVVAGPSMTMFASGTPFEFFNGAIATAPASDPDGAVRELLAFFTSKGRALRAVGARRDRRCPSGRRSCRRARRRSSRRVLMVLHPITSAPAPPPLLDVALATEATDLQTHRDLVVACIGMPVDVAQRLYGDGCLDDPDLAIVIGRVDSVPVATAMLVTSDETAGVYNVVTLPEHRGKGYGAAVTWAVVTEGARRGCTHAGAPTQRVRLPRLPPHGVRHRRPLRGARRTTPSLIGHRSVRPIELAPHGQHPENDVARSRTGNGGDP